MMDLTISQLFTTKNPKDAGCVASKNPLVTIRDRKTQDLLGYLLLVSETTHNRFGGTNWWDVVYIALLQGYHILREEDKEGMERYDLYHVERPKRSLFDGLYGGERNRAFILDRDDNPVDFVLEKPRCNSFLAWRRALEYGLFAAHTWDGHAAEASVDEVYAIVDGYLAVKQTGAIDIWVVFDKDGHEAHKRYSDLWDLRHDINTGDINEAFRLPEAPAEGEESEETDERPKRVRRRRPRCSGDGLLEETTVDGGDDND